MIEFAVNHKQITIFDEERIPIDKVPVVIHHSFHGTGQELWEECVKESIPNFILVNISIENWYRDMTPWKMAPLSKNDQAYEGCADYYLEELTREIVPKIEKKLGKKPLYYAIAGYSLGGLFAIYSLYKTDIFQKAVSGSGSFWYPHFLEFVKNHEWKNTPHQIYLSLGNREKNSKNERLKTVQEKTEELYHYYCEKKIDVFYELNEGGHFQDSYARMAKGIGYILS